MVPNLNCEVILPPEAWGGNAISMHYDKLLAVPGRPWLS